MIDDTLMTVAATAKDLGLSPVTVRAQFRNGRLTGQRITWSPGYSVILINRSSVAHYRDTYLGRKGPKKGGRP